ncbi:hypothetical protein COCHEDRAFT_1211209 [Bipolaris maydis C5]|uniref:Uncharacterized protein n=1 Tax=Cochliobolus heterostrophus (strain C5 / ATCC 48332 / race O) TaxID=701091 RepID=M2UNS9_COCH5|nr:hypothetical protein COCHEDRAFT_1211209 [Bipolaris maydis C5]KAJ6214259.1 hypothetical protein PSV09DRAFT_1211209 [Bipolaris maydis]
MVKAKSAGQPKQKAVANRFPSVSGWATERNAFRMLSEACIQGFKDHGYRIGVIRGSDFSELDGGLIFDPPDGFPMNMDPSDVWAWVHEHKEDCNLQIVPIDIKSSISARSSHQIPPIFMVAPPGHPEILCILPINSYTSIMANMKLEYADSRGVEFNKAHRMRQREPLHVSSLLAPFAVHQRDLFQALLGIRDAFKNQTTYKNPSSGVTLLGWMPPEPDSSLEKVLMVSMSKQDHSARVIQELAQTLHSHPDCHMELLFNLVQPLACDLVLRDNASSTTYLLEHKVSTPKERKPNTAPLKINDTWANDGLNWHFLFHQHGYWLMIHTREGHKVGSNTPVVRIDLRSPGAAHKIADTIRAHGDLAKQRLQTKWRTLDVYESSLSDEASRSTKPLTREMTIHGRAAAREQLRIAFCDAINNQCYKLRKNACIILESSGCGEAVIIQHAWSDRDVARYQASKSLPVSLFGGTQSSSSKALVLNFIPHYWPPSVESSQLFEPARLRMIYIPLCLGQPFIYIAATISAPSADRKPCIEKLIILPSENTDWKIKPDGCRVCDDETRMRDWKPVVQSLVESQGNNNPGSSLVQFPFLNQRAEPLCKVYDFNDGSVHAYFDGILQDQNSCYVTPIYGPKGLLQRQWNHGSPRMVDVGSASTQNMMYRVLTTLPPNTKPMPTERIERIHDDAKKATMEKKGCQSKSAIAYAHKDLISNPEYGMTLTNIMERSGFKTAYTLRCDKCTDEDECCFYIPEIAYGLKAKIACAACWGKSKAICSFNGVMCLVISATLISTSVTIEQGLAEGVKLKVRSVYANFVHTRTSLAMTLIAQKIATKPMRMMAIQTPVRFRGVQGAMYVCVYRNKRKHAKIEPKEHQLELASMNLGIQIPSLGRNQTMRTKKQHLSDQDWYDWHATIDPERQSLLLHEDAPADMFKANGDIQWDDLAGRLQDVEYPELLFDGHDTLKNHVSAIFLRTIPAVALITVSLNNYVARNNLPCKNSLYSSGNLWC